MTTKTGIKGNVKIDIDLSGATAFQPTHPYAIGDLATNTGKTYYCTTAHTSGATFDTTEQLNWVDVTNGAMVSKLNAWKIAIKQALINATYFGDGGWDSSVPGIKDWSGQADGSFNVTDDKIGQKAIQDAITDGSLITLSLIVDDSVDAEKYSGKAYISEVDIDTQTKDLVKFSFKFTGNGPLTMPS
ncbi:phage tail tube protein [Clostridium pasteurianum]|uniref:Phage major tail protein 2 n=1 Tax=Clostridium pasteurianum BC1 TaxID=86416 RepID=R4K8Y2_CLOPA|nr:phage tail tube protein [Clostridium pasteurianum]AGK98166.1 Phage major tail protein 2 [Clostridium pasteurianum BC1]